MNCLEFRRQLGSEPGCSQVAFLAHRDACPQCAAAHRRAEAFESRLRRALEVEVPETLSDRILFAQTTGERQVHVRRRRGAVAALALAASVVVAVILVATRPQPVPPLAAMVFEHVHEHSLATIDASQTMPSEDVMAAFADRGVALASVPEGINYVHKCPVGPYRSVHMVMPEADGLVEVLYVVDAPAPVAAEFEHEGKRGREVPMGKGALVMLASSDADFDAIEGAWRAVLPAAVADAGFKVDERNAGPIRSLPARMGAARSAP